MEDIISGISLLIVTSSTEEAISCITTLSCNKNKLVVLLLHDDLTYSKNPLMTDQKRGFT